MKTRSEQHHRDSIREREDEQLLKYKINIIKVKIIVISLLVAVLVTILVHKYVTDSDSSLLLLPMLLFSAPFYIGVILFANGSTNYLKFIGVQKKSKSPAEWSTFMIGSYLLNRAKQHEEVSTPENVGEINKVKQEEDDDWSNF